MMWSMSLGLLPVRMMSTQTYHQPNPSILLSHLYNLPILDTDLTIPHFSFILCPKNTCFISL
ncbi:hypothetical protein HanRHA438_Chr16g0757941 [Helianthus annuus]|nr:hypothetical protein HanRHA438_Chr16g0757941 [Helianthus annuus]